MNKLSVIFLLTLSTGTLYAQPLTTAAPLLGGVNTSEMVAPVKVNGNTFTAQQFSIDAGTSIYRVTRRKHPYFGRLTIRYQGLYLSGVPGIGSNSFQSFSMSFSHSYIVDKKTSVTFLGTAGFGSDFKQSIQTSDIYFLGGVRFGWQQTQKFQYGLTLAYVNTYCGQFLLPIPDFTWKITDKWTFNGILPLRTSLKYAFTKKQSLGVTMGLNTGMYRLNDEIGEKQYLQLLQYTAGFIYDGMISRHWKFNIIAGHTIVQQLQTFDNSQKLPVDDFAGFNDRVSNVSYKQNSLVLQAGLSFLF